MEQLRRLFQIFLQVSLQHLKMYLDLWAVLVQGVFTLTHFLLMLPFYTPWKHKKQRYFKGQD